MLSELLMIVVGGLKMGAIYSLTAIGIVVIHKATRTVNFAHGAFVLCGAYVTYGIVEVLHTGWWVAFLLASLAGGLLAAVVELGILRPIRQADSFAVITATIFIGIGISEILAVRSMIRGAPLFIGDAMITREQIAVVSGAMAVALVGVALFAYAKFGRGMRAMASNPRGAVLCGYSSDAMNALAWFVGGAMAGVAGSFAAPSTGITAELSVAMVTAGFAAAVIGGFDSLRGALLGGLILGVCETLAAGYVSSAMKNAVSFLLIFIILLWRPQGLFPEAKIRHV
jgi:branched-chain amino acid transport system permease protein